MIFQILCQTLQLKCKCSIFRFIVSVRNELEKAVCEIDGLSEGLSVLETKNLACQEAKTLKDKKVFVIIMKQ